MKYRNKTLKSILSLTLCIVLALTGTSFDNLETVNAATKTTQFINGGTITMKPGDTKKLLFSDENGKDLIPCYKWTVSDKNIVKLSRDFANQDIDYTECLELTAKTSGTVTITGKLIKYTVTTPREISMTVTVKLAKMTAKQKKCKHVYKTTKKATCEREGIKTCKKCKWQKAIPMKAHKYVKTTSEKLVVDKGRVILSCTAQCPKRGCTGNEWTCPVCIEYEDKGMLSPHVCNKEFDTDDYGGSYEATKAAVLSHQFQEHNGGGGYSEYDDPHTHVETYTALICKYCGKEKKVVHKRKSGSPGNGAVTLKIRQNWHSEI